MNARKIVLNNQLADDEALIEPCFLLETVPPTFKAIKTNKSIESTKSQKKLRKLSTKNPAEINRVEISIDPNKTCT